MFRHLQNNKAQAVIGEYVLVIFIVVGAIIAMTVFVQRALQGRIRDAHTTMHRMVFNEYTGNIWIQYEPYYANRTADVYSESLTERFLEGALPGPTSGTFTKTIDQTRAVRTTGSTLPPKDAD